MAESDSPKTNDPNLVNIENINVTQVDESNTLIKCRFDMWSGYVKHVKVLYVM